MSCKKFKQLGPKLSNIASAQPILLWRIKLAVNPTNSGQLCRIDRSHFWQDFYDTKFWSKFGFRQQYSPRRLQDDSLSSNFISGLNLEWIFDRRLCFFGPWNTKLFFRLSSRHFSIGINETHRRRKVHEGILAILAAQPGPNGQLFCLHNFKIF